MFGEMEIIVNCKGSNVTIEVKGGDGDNCLKATKTLEEAMGKVSNREMKSDALRTQNAGAGTVKVGGK